MGPAVHRTFLPGGACIGVPILTLLIGCSAPGIISVPDSDPGRRGGEPQHLSVIEDEVAALVNEHRRGIGLPALPTDSLLIEVAREHSRAMAGGWRQFGHDGFSVRGDLIHDQLRAVSVSENVAYNNYPPDRAAERVVRGWVLSMGHRENLEGTYNRAGVGVAAAPDGKWYVTQVYALVPQ